LGDFRRSEPADLSKPFQLTIHAESAKRGITDLETAVAAIRFDGLFERLPSELQQRERDPDPGADAQKDKPKKPRTADFQLPLALANERLYYTVPPPGFQTKPLPPNAKPAPGPGPLTKEFSFDPEASVRARIEFEIGKRRITAAEGHELRTGVAKVLQGAPLV